MAKKESKKLKKFKNYTIKGPILPINWPTKKYFKKIRRETKGMNIIEFLRYLNKI